MTNKIKKKYDKWSEKFNKTSAECLGAMETVNNGNFLSFLQLVLAVDAERKLAFEAGFIAGLMYKGGKKK